MDFIVETSARHIHLSTAHIEALFGAGAVLHNKKDLSQPGQFACEEKVQLVGPKGSLMVSVLGPARKDTQVELSFTDARTLGLKDSMSSDTPRLHSVRLLPYLNPFVYLLTNILFIVSLSTLYLLRMLVY